MKRTLAYCALLAALVPACRSAAPKGGAATAGPDPLRAYVGDVRLLRAKADQARVKVDARHPLAGSCDMAVRVRAARFDKDGALFSLEPIGRPRLAAGETRCRNIQPGIQLLFAGLTPRSSDVVPQVDAVLQTPEAYLAAHGVRFDRPAAVLPREVASPDVAGRPAEAVLGRKVTAWPKVLLALHPVVHDLSGRVRQESELDFDAVVGTDGRLHDPVVATGLNPAQRDLVMAALSRWRYEPARTADGVVAARISSRLALRVY
jgi:hypothetical protein